MKLIYSIIFCIIFYFSSFSQVKSKCEILNLWFNDTSIIKHFKIAHFISDDIHLIFIDTIKMQCDSTIWGTKVAHFHFDDSINFKLKKLGMTNLFKDSSNYFVVTKFYQNKQIFGITIVHPWSGAIIESTIVFKRRKYIILKTDYYVM